MYRFLLWDIDGTVLNFKAAENLAIKALFKKYNLGDCTDEMIEDYSKINDRYWQALERGEMTKPQILVGRFVEFFESIGVDTEVAEAFNADYQVTLGDFVVFEDNAVEILKEEKEKLNDKGARAYRLIAVTNGTKIAQEKKLKTSGLNEIFDTVYISEDVGIEKPNKGYFDAVIKGEGITDLKETVIIGDSLTSDILGGNNASIDTIWYNPYGKVNDKGVKVTYEIENLSYLREII
ncbi:MAG: YjjG family noncanonical pyrimidine nucleotidase [Lachnospiraceae bacterium]|nr:YjjG family noncanonical pyrimidine nucleotidase [Lachnospiraceae bacterium]